MDDLAIKWWLRYLSFSGAYRRFHLAAQSNDTNRCQELTNRYPKLGALYADFGDIYTQPPHTNAKAFAQWMASRKQLFRPPKIVRILGDVSQAVIDEKHVLIQVAIVSDMDKVKREMESAIDAIYSQVVHRALHIPDYLADPPTPKYSLPSGEEKINTATIGSLRKSFYIARLLSQLQQISGKKITQAELIFAVKLDNKNPFHWSLDVGEEDAVNKEGAAQVYVNSSEMTLVKRHLKLSKAYMKNALIGRFPDAS